MLGRPTRANSYIFMFKCSYQTGWLVGWLVCVHDYTKNTEYICPKFGWILAQKKAILLFSN